MNSSTDHVLRDAPLSQPSSSSRQSPIVTGSSDFLSSPPPFTRGSSTLSDVTVCTTRFDNGEKSATEFISQQVIHSVAPPQDVDNSVPYVKRIKNLLSEAEVQSDWQKTATFFIPCTDFVAIINEDSVGRILKDMANIKSSQRAEAVARICGTDPLGRESEGKLPSFRKVFATLIRIDKHESIFDFMNHDPPISDQDLPLRMVIDSEGKRCGLALASAPKAPIAFTTNPQWSIDERQNFCNLQWALSPTFFAVEGNKEEETHKKVHYQCPAGTILPFVHQPTPPSTFDQQGMVDIRRKPIEGGFSIVSFHKLHTSQQNLKRYTADGPDRLVAVKKLKTSSLEEFQKELKMLIRLTPLPTPHLAKLLTTFEIQGKSSTERDYCFMSETADSNLQEFWGQDPTRLAESLNISPAQLARWMAKQCRGLADAMSLIHNNGYKPDADPDQPRHGFHGDVKPLNVLVYKTWVGHEHPLGILQITDFGISSFHHTASLSGISRGRDAHAYRPPESNLPFMKTTQSHDIWTLGCLFLEFVTWLLKGPSAIPDFREKRRSYGLEENHVINTFYKVDEEDGKTVISISEDVLTWANDLCKHPSASKFICDFIVLITSYMLVIENTGLKASSRRMKLQKNLAATATATPVSSLNGSRTQASSWVPTKRLSAVEVVKALDRMIEQDEDYYARPVDAADRPKLGHHNDGSRQVITFQLSLDQIVDASKEQIE
ncbi:hypothetical protein V8F20_010858 [Naviculisporaceae sp. PSN 640]